MHKKKDITDRYIEDLQRLGYENKEIHDKMIKGKLPSYQVDSAIDRHTHHQHQPFMTLFIIATLIMILLVPAYVYFMYISPSFVDKPTVISPFDSLSEEAVSELNNDSSNLIVTEEHVDYLVNELGGYKLHEDPTTKEPAIIEFYVYDTEQTFSVMIEDNVPVSTEGYSDNADLKVTTDKKNLVTLLTSDDFEATAVELVKENKIGIEIIADEKTLILKGYKTIYDTLEKKSDLPTGQFIQSVDMGFQ